MPRNTFVDDQVARKVPALESIVSFARSNAEGAVASGEPLKLKLSCAYAVKL
jgi:hypothetical protein